MDDFWKTVLWQQFGAAIDMLENAMRACPDDLWSNTKEKPAWVKKSVVGFWYVVYHTSSGSIFLYRTRNRDSYRRRLSHSTSWIRRDCFPSGLIQRMSFNAISTTAEKSVARL
jgi:hypothetical protein